MRLTGVRYVHSAEWVPVGDPAEGLTAPEESCVTVEGDATSPSVTVCVRVIDGRPVCNRVTVETTDGSPVTARDLSRVPVGDLVAELLATFVVVPPSEDRQPPPGSTPAPELVGYRPSPASVAAVVASQRRRRVEVTADRLRQVAAIYAEGGAEAVGDQLHLSKSQAFRLVQRARREGHLIEDNTPQEEP